MDLNYILIWLVGAAGIALFLRAALVKRVGWMATAALVLGVGGGAYLAVPSAGGYIGGGALALFVVAPLWGYRVVFRLTLMQEYARAARLARWLRWLHPADGWLEWPAMLAALASGDREIIAQAARELKGRGSSRTGIGSLGIALLHRLSNQWRELLDWLHTHLSPAELNRDPNLVGLCLRAHGELGDPNALLVAFDACRRATAAPPLWLYRSMSRLMAFAFCGRRDLVEALFDGPLDLFPKPVQRFWLATADMAAGNVAPAREELEALRGQCDPLTTAGIEQRLSHPLPVAAEVLTAESRAALERIVAEADQEVRYGAASQAIRRRAYVTWSLIGLNLIVFLIETLRGGSTNPVTLEQMGALIPSLVAQGEWWRVVTALFLHYGPLHIAFNALALLILGPYVEFAIGRLRGLLTYLAAGIGSMIIIVLVFMNGQYQHTLLVGASGGIMGLVGATAAIHLRGWMRERAHLSRRRLMFLLIIVVAQAAFDLATPESSFLAHFGGVVLGFLVAALIPHRGARIGGNARGPDS